LPGAKNSEVDNLLYPAVPGYGPGNREGGPCRVLPPISATYSPNVR
jgi:hypothetical protein